MAGGMEGMVSSPIPISREAGMRRNTLKNHKKCGKIQRAGVYSAQQAAVRSGSMQHEREKWKYHLF